MNDKLEPCPFCGCDAVLAPHAMAVWCTGCETIRANVHEWNRRALPDLAKVRALAKAEAFEEAHDFVAALGRSDGCAKIKFTADALRKEAA